MIAMKEPHSPVLLFPKAVAGGQLGKSGSRASRYGILIFFFSRELAKSIIFYLFSNPKWISQVLILSPLEPMWTSVCNILC